MIQEFRFNEYCKRLQNYIVQKLDDEFKLFLRWRGFNIDSGLFDIRFNEPQNFAAYRQSELDKDRVATFGSMEAYPYISKRFALQRFLGLTEEEINENERMWREENDKEIEIDPEGKDLRSIGISSGDIETDLQTGEEAVEGEDMQMNPEIGPAGEVPQPTEAGMGTPAPAGNGM
jgi:hypothetical protein